MNRLTDVKRIAKSNNPSTLRVPGNNRSYNHRLRAGFRFEDTVKRHFNQLFGITLHPYGLDHQPKEARNNLVHLNDKTSELIRFLPDFYFTIPRGASIFVEVKSSLTNTANYSINKGEYNTQFELASRGCSILCVFPPVDSSNELRAEWLINLDHTKTKIMNDPEKLKQGGGSRKPFILVPKHHTRELKVVVNALLNEGVVWWWKLFFHNIRLSEIVTVLSAWKGVNTKY